MQDTGTFTHTTSPRLQFASKIEAPHLQRRDPTGRWLASFDAAAARFTLRPFNPGGASPVTLQVRGLSGVVKTFRWLGDGTGLVVHTSKNLFVVRGGQANASVARARPVFDEDAAAIKDFRMLGSAFIARTGSRLFFVRPTPAIEVEDITPDEHAVTAASVLSGHRIVMAVAKTGLRPSKELWTLSTSHGPTPIPVSQRPCAGSCRIDNWTPGSDLMAYVLDHSKVRVELPSNGGPATEIELMVNPKMGFAPIHSLWRNPDQDRLLAASPGTVHVWSSAGASQWTWGPPTGQSIRSARFDSDGRTLLLTLSHSIVRVRDGRVTETLLTRAQAATFGASGHRAFLDDGVSLPDGSVAFALVTERTRHSRRRNGLPPKRVFKPPVLD